MIVCSPKNYDISSMSAHMPRHDHQKVPMIPHPPIHTITIKPRSAAGIHDILRHMRDPGESHGYFPSSLFWGGFPPPHKKKKLGIGMLVMYTYYLSRVRAEFEAGGRGRKQKDQSQPTSFITKMAECHEQLGRVLP